MKKLIIIILFIGFQANAQFNIPVEQMQTYLLNRTSNYHYFKDINGVFNKFVGNWRYENGTDLVEISIYKAEYREGGIVNSFDDELNIEFKFTQNGAVIFNTFGENRTYYISGLRFQIPSNTNKYRLLYLEPTQKPLKAYQYVDIEYIPNTSGGQPQLNWDVSSDPKSVSYIPPIMPLNMVFTKLP